MKQVFLLAALVGVVFGQILTEIYPSGDAGEEYIEILGTPNQILPVGTFYVAIEGEFDQNRAQVDLLWNLGGVQLGSNGVLVLLPNGMTGLSIPSAAATIADRSVSFEGGSVTHMIIHVADPANYPTNGLDVDANKDGWLDGKAAGWTILDSVGNINEDSVSEIDITYGRTVFVFPGRDNSLRQYATKVVYTGPVNDPNMYFFNMTWIGVEADDGVASGETWPAGTFPPTGGLVSNVGLPNFAVSTSCPAAATGISRCTSTTRTYEEARADCGAKGQVLAGLTSSNLFNLAGTAGSNNWVSSWNGDSYGGSCLMLNWPAIIVGDCNAKWPYLCQSMA